MSNTSPQFISGVHRFPLGIHLIFRVLKTGFTEMGFPGFIIKLLHYLRGNIPLARGSAGRWLVTNYGVYAATALPPIDSSRFINYLIEDIRTFCEGKISPLLFAILSVSARCPYRCRHCYALDLLSDQEQVPAATLEAAIQGLSAWGARDIFLSGGEPFMRKQDLEDITTRTAHLVDGFWLVTSGWGYDHELLKRMIHQGLKGIVVSLDDYRKERVCASKGHPDAWRNAISAIKMSAKTGIIVSVDCLVHPEILNRQHFFAFTDFCHELGVHFINFFPPEYVGGAAIHNMECINEAGLALLETMIWELNNKKRYRNHPIAYSAVLWEKYRGCSGGRQFVYIDPCGGVRPCPFLNQLDFNIKTMKMEDILGQMRSLNVRMLCPSRT